MTFNSVLNKYRKVSFSERDKGTHFERLMRAYLLPDPQYTTQLKNVFLWEDFFACEELGGVDTGIDLVGETHYGEFWAIQCKCYQESSKIDKPEVDTFLSTSGRIFHCNNEKKDFHTGCGFQLQTTGLQMPLMQ